MKSYLDILENVLRNGHDKKPVRKNSKGQFVPVDGGVLTIGLPSIHFEHNMEEGFPLLTTKKMAVKSMAVELEGFIKGITDKRWYQERGCKFWNQWANPKAIYEEDNDISVENYPSSMIINTEGPQYEPELTEWIREKQKEAKLKTNDLGPIYGYQWRSFDEDYGPQIPDEPYNGIPKGQGADQLKNLVDTLRNNPNDRRMVVSAWNPNQMHMMALPPCHLLWNVVVYGDKLNLHWHQRSCDLVYGVPVNIASYALLLCLLARDSGFKPGKLSATFADCHIYENQIPGCIEQLERQPKPLPTLKLTGPKDIFKWTHKDFHVENYQHYPKLDFGKVAV